MFGCFFVGHSYPIPAANFHQVDQTHWVLDVCSMVTPQYWELKEVALFLVAPGSLDPALALGLYVRSGGDWLYRGCVHGGHPSEVMPLQWPSQEGGYGVPPAPGVVQYARRVGLDLYRFLESFAKPAADAILIPTSALDRWLNRFERKFRLDPEFLTRQEEKF